MIQARYFFLGKIRYFFVGEYSKSIQTFFFKFFLLI